MIRQQPRRFNLEKMRNQLARDTSDNYYYIYRTPMDDIRDACVTVEMLKETARDMLIDAASFWEKKAERKYVPKGYEIVRDFFVDFDIDYNMYRVGIRCRVRKEAS